MRSCANVFEYYKYKINKIILFNHKIFYTWNLPELLQHLVTKFQ